MVFGPSSAENHIDSIYDGSHVPWRQLSDSLGELASVQGYDQGDIRDRILRQPGYSRSQQDVAGSCGPLDVACEGNTDDRPDPAPIDGIALNDQNRASEAWTRSG